MTKIVQYIDFTTLPGVATLWDTIEGAPDDAVPIELDELRALAHPSTRYEVQDVGGGDFQIVDTVEGWEVAMVTSHSDLTEETIERCKAVLVDALNKNALAQQMDWECEPED